VAVASPSSQAASPPLAEALEACFDLVTGWSPLDDAGEAGVPSASFAPGAARHRRPRRVRPLDALLAVVDELQEAARALCWSRRPRFVLLRHGVLVLASASAVLAVVLEVTR